MMIQSEMSIFGLDLPRLLCCRAFNIFKFLFAALLCLTRRSLNFNLVRLHNDTTAEKNLIVHCWKISRIVFERSFRRWSATGSLELSAKFVCSFLRRICISMRSIIASRGPCLVLLACLMNDLIINWRRSWESFQMTREIPSKRVCYEKSREVVTSSRPKGLSMIND